jgi:DNA-binding NtrC family response regulator
VKEGDLMPNQSTIVSPISKIEKPFTNERLSTALSPNLQKQQKNREKMLEKNTPKGAHSLPKSPVNGYLNSVISRVNQGMLPYLALLN